MRLRLARQTGPRGASEEERRIALGLRVNRAALGAVFAGVEACRSCARPRSRDWPGGHCCAGRTERLFTDPELAALRLAGTTPASLRLPTGEHAGCAFRGPTGCSLDPVNRPSLCVRYACRELETELRHRPDRAAIAHLRSELRAGFERFIAVRAARLDAEWLQGVERQLAGLRRANKRKS